MILRKVIVRGGMKNEIIGVYLFNSNIVLVRKWLFLLFKYGSL